MRDLSAKCDYFLEFFILPPDTRDIIGRGRENINLTSPAGGMATPRANNARSMLWTNYAKGAQVSSWIRSNRRTSLGFLFTRPFRVRVSWGQADARAAARVLDSHARKPHVIYCIYVQHHRPALIRMQQVNTKARKDGRDDEKLRKLFSQFVFK